MIRRPPRSTRTDTLFPYPTLFRSILTQMAGDAEAGAQGSPHAGQDFASVLAEAQRLGYAEADPSFDVDGIDTAHKLAILTALAFGCAVDFGAGYVEGIRNVSSSEESRVGKEWGSQCTTRW